MKRRPKMNENGVDPPKRYADLLNPMIKTQLQQFRIKVTY